MKVPWYSVYSFLFLFFRSCGYGDYFKSAILKVTSYQLYLKFFLNNYDAHWQLHLKDTLQFKNLWTWINICANLFLGDYHETKMGKDCLEIISCTKIRACSSKNITPGHLIYHAFFFFSQTDLVFKFNLVLIEQFSIQFVYLITFWYSVHLQVHPVSLRFL